MTRPQSMPPSSGNSETTPPPVEDRWLRCREVADLLAMSERQVWRLAQSDVRAPALLEPTRLRLPGRKRPLTRWKLSDVQQVLTQCETT